MMKKLKRRLSKAFKGSNSNIADLSGPSSLFLHQANGVHLIGANPVNSNSISGYQSTQMKAWHLSNSMSRLSERLAVDGVILEESCVDYNPDGSSNHDSCYNSSSTLNYEPVRQSKTKGRPVSMHTLYCRSQMVPVDNTMVQIQPRHVEVKKNNKNRYSWHASRLLGSQTQLSSGRSGHKRLNKQMDQ
ncbi:unnamed protein product [Bursaphelenchus okinawaensis]|uniref:Uncharacterized protein n=1 Tax=Bursaphelenchus okinawaensis TaxID=465554 RepID=A0A811KUK1_9BILA|nr:unnamed protein product [Bursaphelenchus okinawaensis]CAG9112545.1 unnamed protein product [Bursaphelenchus okinawaensis]